jgi:hypothetical protein
MLILYDLRVLSCLTAMSPRSVSNPWHFLRRSHVAVLDRLVAKDVAADPKTGQRELLSSPRGVRSYRDFMRMSPASVQSSDVGTKELVFAPGERAEG